MAVCARAACAAASATAPSNVRIMVSSSGTPSLKDRGRRPDQSLMMFGKMKPKLRMQTASLSMNIAFCCGFISPYGVPVDFFCSMEFPFPSTLGRGTCGSLSGTNLAPVPQEVSMRIALLLCVLAGGCATAVSEKECRTNDWYGVGEREALAGRQPQFERYARDCGQYAVKPSESDYMAG